jgi:type IV pilus assembly protein PilA
MLEKLRTRSAEESGFTLVELLVVMLILGILAAIAIPAFFSQRDKAKDSDAKAQVNTAQTAMETCATDNNGSYAACNTTAKLQAIEPTIKSTVSVGTPTSNTYTITATSATTNTFSVARASGGAVTYPCSVPATTGNPNAGCPAAAGASGFWAT